MKLYCDIALPASKSESNRALMIAAYAGFTPDFQNLSDSNDTLVLDKALRQTRQNDALIDIADCGTAARFMATWLACQEGNWFLTGSERMSHRPFQPLVDALRILGADIQCVEKEGFLPFQIQGKPIQGGKVSINMTQSSQFASSLLLAAPMWPQGLEMELLGDLSSLPYLEMTLCMMRRFSAKVERQGRTIMVKPQPYQEQSFAVEPDWSAASYWYEMAAFSEDCEVRLRALNGSKDRHSLQGDAIIAEWMAQLGVGTFVEGEDFILRKIPCEKRPLHFDFFNHPDLYPTLAATCVGIGMDACFTGLNNLHLKESDRVAAMQAELAKLSDLPAHFCSHDDHRIVMALAPLSMLLGPVSFDHPEVVEKSYPNFWNDALFLPVNR